MKYACIGEHLKHSFSKEIHNALADYEYEIKEIPREKLEAFAKAADFLAINVTIPYKELIIPYMYEIDAHAKAIGAVNTVVNREGKLYGYNTDFYGMTELFRHAEIDPKSKKAAILGTGGTAKTARAVLESLEASEILTVSRSAGDDTISYEELYKEHSDIEIVVNTTPVGMFPDTEKTPLKLDGFKKLEGLIDAVYNPLRTTLVSDAKCLGIKAEGGLYMLVAQAVRASEIFLDTSYPKEELERVYQKLLSEKETLVLIGMPSSGKSTLGRELAKLLGREFYDTDSLIEENSNMKIPDIFKKYGEEKFRELESEAIFELSKKTGIIIATGGGAVLREKNVSELRKNGKIIFLDRPVAELTPTVNRPLAKDREAIKKRYEERYPIYTASADATIKVEGTPENLARRIKENLL